jgi:hypothetical protein
MARQRIKTKDLERLKEGLKQAKPVKVARGHTVSKPVQTHDNQRRYDRKRDKDVKSTDLE